MYIGSSSYSNDIPAPFSAWEMLALQWVQRELWQPLKPIQNQKAAHWCIALQHNYRLHSDKAREAMIIEHICQENLLVIWVPRCPLLIICTRINKPFSIQDTWDLLQPFSLESEEQGRNQVGSPGPVHRTLQTEHKLKKSQDIIIFLTLVLLISTGQEEESYSKKAEKRSQAKPRSHTSNTPIDKWTEHPTPG